MYPCGQFRRRNLLCSLGCQNETKKHLEKLRSTSQNNNIIYYNYNVLKNRINQTRTQTLPKTGSILMRPYRVPTRVKNIVHVVMAQLMFGSCLD